eukprot:symbB.v1.2.001691.t1/scaffold93.1/size335462/6
MGASCSEADIFRASKANLQTGGPSTQPVRVDNPSRDSSDSDAEVSDANDAGQPPKRPKETAGETAILLGPNTKAEKDLCGHAGQAQRQAKAYKIEGCQVQGPWSDYSEVQRLQAASTEKALQ